MEAVGGQENAAQSTVWHIRGSIRHQTSVATSHGLSSFLVGIKRLQSLDLHSPTHGCLVRCAGASLEAHECVSLNRSLWLPPGPASVMQPVHPSRSVLGFLNLLTKGQVVVMSSLTFLGSHMLFHHARHTLSGDPELSTNSPGIRLPH